MRKSLGTIARGTEIVFWMLHHKNHGGNYDDPVLSADALAWLFFNKTEWNPDWYNSCMPDPPGFGPPGTTEPPPPPGPTFDKTFQLDQDTTEGTCQLDGGWLRIQAYNRLKNNFGLDMADSDYSMPITVGDKFSHFIVGAPKDDANQWVLGIEQNNSQLIFGRKQDPPDNLRSDVDCNDLVFKIERKRGGTAELKAQNPITGGSGLRLPG
jgi:hypothetical protein